MSKLCILDSNKICNDCRECDKCDLDSNKICNNCGKCLQMEGYDAKAINIDEVLETSDDIANIDDYDTVSENEKVTINIEELADQNKDLKEEDVHIEFIDDIDGLSELLQNQKENIEATSMEEVFPGFMVLNRNKK